MHYYLHIVSLIASRLAVLLIDSEACYLKCVGLLLPSIKDVNIRKVCTVPVLIKAPL